MHTNSWRRRLGMWLLATVAGVVFAESAQAQQMGLFPLHPIKRKRVPCDQEDPVYRIYKDQYFGYHPTLWRRFPSGWGAPSPEAPNKEQNYKEIPLLKPDWATDMEPGAEEGAQPGAAPAQPNTGRPNLPPAPAADERSPFEIDDKPGAAPRPETPPRQEPATRTPNVPAAPDAEKSPFDIPAAPRASTTRSPELSSPTGPSASRTGRTRRSSEVDAAEAGGPLLAMPDTSLDDAYRAPELGAPAAAAAEGPQHVHQPPRRGRLASMMDNLGWNVSRR